jgi:peptidoglycan/xylan/chitin deacetylase (PgdA/CDA1 family)
MRYFRIFASLLCFFSFVAPFSYLKNGNACTQFQATKMKSECVFMQDYQEEYFDPPAFLSEENKKQSAWNANFADISRIKKERKLIAFTFDDAPGKTLESLLAVFSSFNEQNPDCPAYATLFCNGVRITNESKPLLHAALALGWELGNHTYSHPHLTSIGSEELIREIEMTESVLLEMTGYSPRLFRPPEGVYSQTVSGAIKQTPYIPILWTVDTEDWRRPSAEAIALRAVTKTESGVIILCHDFVSGKSNTPAALRILLPKLIEQGYQFVTVSELLESS